MAIVAPMIMQMLASIYSGYSGMQASNQEAGLQYQQGRIAMQQANANATNTAEQIGNFQGDQEEAYLSSGVTLAGSPILELARTHALGQQQVNAMIAQGKAQQDLSRRQAQITMNSGRSAFIGSILGGASTAASDYLKAKPNGGLNPKAITQTQADNQYKLLGQSVTP